MAKTKISEYDSTAANNTDIDSINIAEGMAPSNVNNAIRELMAHLKDMDAGTQSLTSPSISSSLGIGTTSPTSYANSQATLVVEDSSNPAIAISDTGQTRDWFLVALGDGLGVRYADGGGSGSASNLTESAFFKNDGNVGIGTSSPSYGKLHIADGNSDIAMDANGSGQLHIDGNGYGFGVALNAVGAQLYTNTASRDIIFGTDETERMRIDGSGNVGIGTTSPAAKFELEDGGTSKTVLMKITADDSSPYSLIIGNDTYSTSDTDGLAMYVGNSGEGTINMRGTSSSLQFRTVGSERMRIDSSGDVFIGTTDANLFNETSGGETGHHFRNDGRIYNTTDSNTNIIFNRCGTDGNYFQFRKNGSTVGVIGTDAGGLYIGDSDVALSFDGADDDFRPFDSNTQSVRDNVIDIGHSNARFDDINATNATIQTSDEREKQQIASLTDAEMTAAKAISKLFKTYKWNSSVESKGDNARIHTGVIAQQVETVMSDAGLDISKYAFYISTTWWETTEEIAATSEIVDEDGNVVTPAKDAFTKLNIYNHADEAPEGATERNRKGIRYPELLSFIGAATEQRLTSIEARLDALEAE